MRTDSKLSGALIGFHCVNPECESSFTDVLFVDSAQAPCPKCGEKTSLLQVQAIHFIFPDKFGQITSKADGRAYKFGCEAAFKAFRHGTRHPNYPVYYTPVISAVTCAECLRLYGVKITEGDVYAGR